MKESSSRTTPLGEGVTIGRLPDNAVIIDNPAVSGHHARVFFEGARVVLEDLRSTNGTFVNGRPVRDTSCSMATKSSSASTARVRSGGGRAAAGAGAPMAGLGDTVYLDTKQHQRAARDARVCPR